jgi:hypothetical protein
MSRRLGLALLMAVAIVVAVAGAAAGGLFGNAPSSRAASSPGAGVSATASGAVADASTGPSVSPSAVGSPSTSPTPAPTPVLVPGPLDGLPISPRAAALHPIAVMIDDLSPARPQSGFSDASVVWQAPAEGGIPRYMLVFQEGLPKDVGPVRSSRYYYIAWAAEWHALYVHAGGSPQALQTLRAQGAGQLVYNADQFFHGLYFRRVTFRFPPHNLYTTGKQLRQLASSLGATAPSGPAVWRFGPDAPLEVRPIGSRIEVDYQANSIVYTYDRTSNTYPRYVSGGVRQIDQGTKVAIAPKNVVVMRMAFGPLDDGHPAKHRLEAKVVDSGTAWIATNGVTIKGTWRKKSLTAPTQFFDASGKQVTLTAGQTFVQVMKTTDVVTITQGTLRPPTSPGPGASSNPTPSPGLGASPSPS